MPVSSPYRRTPRPGAGCESAASSATPATIGSWPRSRPTTTSARPRLTVWTSKAATPSGSAGPATSGRPSSGPGSTNTSWTKETAMGLQDPRRFFGPDHRGTIGLNWALGDFGANLLWHYIAGDSIEDFGGATFVTNRRHEHLGPVRHLRDALERTRSRSAPATCSTRTRRRPSRSARPITPTTCTTCSAECPTSATSRISERRTRGRCVPGSDGQTRCAGSRRRVEHRASAGLPCAARRGFSDAPASGR